MARVPPSYIWGEGGAGMTGYTETFEYQKVLPREHDAACRRGIDPTSRYWSLDVEQCERCANLWNRVAVAPKPPRRKASS